ncbi:MAG: excinuclease ABC subunit UvrB [Candidatus Komeilibacteria bacterium CG_4_10_14_0_2_um_filter_37_10]|uniref:UvrABC system protein B n=1 Tax=Candidatus Komeilibacteria bacterium CG_4_10_14_0_2_um_filter_37_10 TaxID=1974470 RepID=A0A2M7VGL4_9BACT|nr:MAG: excinuclease ABC subunit UvrB [Candidatus Komeilibacteria bacterium CG_4_10_14_0_2_um_filter_37_10]PJA92688.1 MAG: excinuclease ABC subunit UvrB [Candidatus Komeilibacteria bacterium CG_4_9_14_3_um_filter_37_5]
MKFQLTANFQPTGDQPTAIKKLIQGLKGGKKDQILLGVTGSGKTFTMANIIAQTQKPTLIISHNKTLAAQLASEFKDFFPQNEVHYFVSYYDYYQPEAYLPRTDTYIEKETQINEEIDRLRHASTQAILSRKDVIIVASVSCIYNLGDPTNYQKMSLELKINTKKNRQLILRELVDLQYSRNDIAWQRGTFRVHGEIVDIFPIASSDYFWHLRFDDDRIANIDQINIITLKKINTEPLSEITIFPAKHYLAPANKIKSIFNTIRNDLSKQLALFKKQNKLLEAQRLEQRTNYDLEMIEAVGYCSGIENYSRYFDGRLAGAAPYTLIDYFPKDYLLFIDESHMTVPQLSAMYNGDQARKKTLIDFGFRLPAAIDNRPLKFTEIEKKFNQVIYVSATPGPYEYEKTDVPVLRDKLSWRVNWPAVQKKLLEKNSALAEQIIRPTGLLDPEIIIRSTKHQVDDLLNEIAQRVKNKQRVLITTLTKKMSEQLTEYLQERRIKVQYLHSEVQTMERLDILNNLRLGKIDVVVGINLLREGLDLPEVSLVAILDADKEGFLRSETALIQTMGRAARHVEGRVIMYADKITGSMQRAMDIVTRRRQIQLDYNKKHNITPRSISKEIRKRLTPAREENIISQKIAINKLNDQERKTIIRELMAKMELAAQNMEFELAAEIRDQIKELKNIH